MFHGSQCFCVYFRNTDNNPYSLRHLPPGVLQSLTDSLLSIFQRRNSYLLKMQITSRYFSNLITLQFPTTIGITQYPDHTMQNSNSTCLGPTSSIQSPTILPCYFTLVTPAVLIILEYSKLFLPHGLCSFPGTHFA